MSSSPSSDKRHFRSLRLEPYYQYTARQLPAAAAFLDQLCLEADSIMETLVHGDFSPKNVLVRADRQLIEYCTPGSDPV